MKKSWIYWSNCTTFLFKILFPKAQWLPKPKSNHILSFYKHLNKIQAFALQKIRPFVRHYPTIIFYQNLLDFFQHLIPFIFTYKQALKRRNFTFLLDLQPKLWLLLTLTGFQQYSKAVMFQNYLFHYWRINNHYLFHLLQKQPTFFNEEIGEISLSTVARSTHNTSEHLKTEKLKENFPFVSKIQEAETFFGITLPFKTRKDGSPFTTPPENADSEVVLRGKLPSALREIEIDLTGLFFNFLTELS